jgi:hypothetical protein
MSQLETISNEQGQQWLNTLPDSETGLQIGSVNGKISVLGSTPVIQQVAAGETTGFTAATGTAVLAGSTFTGGVGASAYTLGDIVAALKNYGWLAA